MRTVLRWFLALVVLAAIGGGIWYGVGNALDNGAVYSFKEETIGRGDLASTISASGTVEPEELVNVGAQVTGKIMNFGTDADGKPIDYGSRVTQGMLLAKIDDVLYEAELRESKAAKLQADVAILSAEASVKQAKARLVLAERNWVRAKDLQPKGALARSEYDSCEAEYLSRKADIAVAEAALEQAKARATSAEASLIKAQRNLDFCFIKSPVDGVIIDRRVSVGQTLVSSMSASSIFLIAKDLRKMQVWVSVNEADIGSIKVGMPATFTVDAFTGTVFAGTVHKIRLNATMSQNVVTYVVEVATDNASGKLLPYLTANVNFIRAQRKDVLYVSNAALRYVPPADRMAPGAAEVFAKFNADRAAKAAAPAGKRGPREAILWKPNAAGKVEPLRVTVGLNDGRRSEVSGEGLAEGMKIVSGLVEGAAPAADAKNAQGKSPFLPTPPQRRSSNPNQAPGGRPAGGGRPM